MIANEGKKHPHPRFYKRALKRFENKLSFIRNWLELPVKLHVCIVRSLDAEDSFDRVVEQMNPALLSSTF
ncbi:MAG: hypothetical protein KME08_02780 [Aphanothece sp. CMT-3BRIN-NPC111]|nr:hypothetical protein [Aphanothece sp. CMT-3BRIN-NPC111]